MNHDMLRRSAHTFTLGFLLVSTIFAPRALAQNDEDPPDATPTPDTFEGDTPLELTLGVGNGGSLGIGLVLAPEVSIGILGVGYLATGGSNTFVHGVVGASLVLAFVRPRVGEIVPVAELYGGVSAGSSTGTLGQSGPSGQASVTGGIAYVLDRHLAVRALVGPSAVFGSQMVSVSVHGQLALVYRP